jgi:5-hydroxyisourate hydrolase-like protein (transthyretin family)
MKKFILIIIVSISMACCKKMGNGRITGTVTEKGSGLPLSNVEVKLERSTRSGENAKTYPTIIESTVTDENGSFALPFQMKLRYKYRVYTEPAEHSPAGEYLSEKKEKIDLIVSPFGYIEIHLHKTSNLATEYAELNVDHSNVVVLNVPNYPFDRIQGVYKVRAADNVGVYWTQRYNSNQYKEGVKQLYVAKGDTVVCDVNLE